MKTIKATWEDITNRYGETIEGVVDWTLKYMRIWFCFLGTLFLVCTALTIKFFGWFARTYFGKARKSSRQKVEADTKSLC